MLPPIVVSSSTMPVESGSVIVLSFVGSVIVNVVSNESAVAPSNIIALLSKPTPRLPAAPPVPTSRAATSEYNSVKLSFILPPAVRRSSPVPSLPLLPTPITCLAFLNPTH